MANLLIGVAVLALVLSRQLMTRRLSESYRLPVILAVIGIVEFVQEASSQVSGATGAGPFAGQGPSGA